MDNMRGSAFKVEEVPKPSPSPHQMAVQVKVEEVPPPSPSPSQMAVQVKVEEVPPPSLSPPQMAVKVEEAPPPSPSPPQMAVQVKVEEVPPPSPSPPPSLSCNVPSSALVLECESASSVRRSPQSPLDEEIHHHLFYGSEADSSDSGEEDDLHPYYLIPRAQRSLLETPLDVDEVYHQPAADAPAPAPEDAHTSYVPHVVPSAKMVLESASSVRRSPQSPRDEEIHHHLFYGSEPDSSDSGEDDDLHSFYLIPRAQMSLLETPLDEDEAHHQPAAHTSYVPHVVPSVDQPCGLYEFDWKPFPKVPIPPESRREMFSHNDVGPTVPCVDPYEIFISIWDRPFMEYIASETNRYAQQLMSRLPDANDDVRRDNHIRWYDTTADELYVYFGLVIAMGLVVTSDIADYWASTPDIIQTPGFGAHMSRSRFLLISKCLHFVNNEDMRELDLGASEAKLFKVQPLLSHLNNKFQSLYRLGQNIALDQSLLQWKGGLDFGPLFPNKAATMGIKTHEICEPQTGYLWRFEVHAIGKSQRSPPQQFEDPMKASTPATVLRLIQGLEGKGHTLWMDSYYNSPSLARRLKGLGFDCVGTLRTDREFVPQALHSLNEENMARNQISGLTSGDVDVMVWRDKYRIAMISTYHGNFVARARDPSTKPILIIDYNIMMGGVDKKDQMLAMCPIVRKQTKVWYKKLFQRLLNVSVLNSFVIYRQSFSSASTSSLSHRNFLTCLVDSLLCKHHPATVQRATTPRVDTQYDSRFHHLAEYPFGARSKQRLRRKCGACRKLVQTYCVGCSKAMCMSTCFLALHK